MALGALENAMGVWAAWFASERWMDESGEMSEDGEGSSLLVAIIHSLSKPLCRPWANL